MLEIMAIFGLVDILRTIGILAFATLCGWIIYRAMKNAGAEDENEDDEENEENNNKEEI